MKVPLKQYAKDIGKSYHTVYSWHKEGKIKTLQEVGGAIMVQTDDPLPVIPAPTTALVGESPLFESVASTSRTNRSATIERIDRFTNIEDAVVPYKRIRGGHLGYSLYSIRETVILAQKAYYSCYQVRNAIETMVDFSVGNIFWEGGTHRSREFFESLFNSINLWNFATQFFRECYRSGNIFAYRYDTEVNSKEALKLSQAAEIDLQGKVTLPIKYVVMNPAEIMVADNISYLANTYYRYIDTTEIARLRNPANEQDRMVFDLMPEDVKKQIKNGSNSVVQLLNPDKFIPIFYQKQDYEAFAIPLVWPVMDQLNYRKELEKMDAAIARTWQQIVLLVTTGAPPDEGGINKNNINELINIFKNQSIGRALVADYTTKVEWKIPQIADILDPKKYAVIDESIKEGLNNILVGSEKFANQSTKVRVFAERMNQGKDLFLKGFLIPEVKRISNEMGFRSYPIPKLSEIDLQDTNQYNRIYTRLVEIGAITPNDGIQAINTGKLPTSEENLESQILFKEAKDKGLYQPIIGGAKQEGRPLGATSDEPVKRQNAPIGQSNAKYEIGQIAKNINLLKELKKIISKITKDKQNITYTENITEMIIAAEKPENWIEKAKEYCEGTSKATPEQLETVFKIMDEHKVEYNVAAVLLHSIVNNT